MNETKKKIPKNVVVLGLASFFNDIASEMVYPIVPIFMTSILKASTSVIGLVEGVAESTAAISKFIFGYWSDRIKRRKPFVTTGYILSSLSKAAIGLANTWPLVLFSRFLDRLGKGVRTASRDALLLENTNQKNKGLIFGFHRAFDSAGAVLGPTLGLILLHFYANNLRLLFYLATIPGLMGVFLFIFLLKEKGTNVKNGGKYPIRLSGFWKRTNSKVKLFLIISFIFFLGNSSDAFLILRAKDLGLTTQLAVVAYILYNLSQTIFSTPLGQLSDKIGHRKTFASGLLIFSLVYLSFGLIRKSYFLWLLFPIYGIYIAATDGISKAYIGEFVDEKESGSVFGLYQTLIAIASFFASYIGGILWTKINPSATFYFGSAMAFISFVTLSVGKFWKKI